MQGLLPDYSRKQRLLRKLRRNEVPDNAGGPIDASGAKALVAHQFPTLQAYSAETHNDQHSILVDYDAFENVKHLDAKDLKTVQSLYKSEEFDFRLKPGSAPVDKGMMIPNVTDTYTGTAPDLGALEVGLPAPHYGPRPDTPETE